MIISFSTTKTDSDLTFDSKGTHHPLVMGIITLKYMAQTIKRIFTLSLLPLESQSSMGLTFDDLHTILNTKLFHH